MNGSRDDCGVEGKVAYFFQAEACRGGSCKNCR